VAEALPDLDVPARVVWGDADPFQPIGHGARLATALGTSVRALPGALHFTPEDHPTAIADSIRELIAA
jgi:pimeloyl-ACP methyl ester carboxylesterase